jgi:hypothetical protein
MEKLDEWLETVKQCKFLPEQDLKVLCEIVKVGIFFFFFFFFFFFGFF